MPASEKVEINGKQHVVKKIPQKVIQNAVGLCIFTTMRTGLWVSGAGGSGVLVARLPDGSWSPPSGVLLHTAGLGFLVGVDIYDCVIVINTASALAAFENPRFTIGGEFSAVAGPVGAGGLLEAELHKRQAPVFNYIKSRGFYAGVQVDGTVIIERGDENERFYGRRLKAKEILEGKVRAPREVQMLMETLKAAQGDVDVDSTLLPRDDEPAPGDYELVSPAQPGFGVPAPEDPDPFGAKALLDTGLDIHEAGTGARPREEEFEFHPAPTSPVYGASVDAGGIEEVMGRRRANTLGQVEEDEKGEKRRTLGDTSRKEGTEADIGGDGSGRLREGVEKEAEEARMRDELESPKAEMKVVDPVAEVGEGLENVDLGNGQEPGPKVHPTGLVDANGEEILEDKKGAQEITGEKVEEPKKGPPPALPPR